MCPVGTGQLKLGADRKFCSNLKINIISFPFFCRFSTSAYSTWPVYCNDIFERNFSGKFNVFFHFFVNQKSFFRFGPQIAIHLALAIVDHLAHKSSFVQTRLIYSEISTLDSPKLWTFSVVLWCVPLHCGVQKCSNYPPIQLLSILKLPFDKISRQRFIAWPLSFYSPLLSRVCPPSAHAIVPFGTLSRPSCREWVSVAVDTRRPESASH